MRQQIDPWNAIEFAIKIDDHFDRLEFLTAVQHGDVHSLNEDWPEFVAQHPA